MTSVHADECFAVGKEHECVRVLTDPLCAGRIVWLFGPASKPLPGRIGVQDMTLGRIGRGIGDVQQRRSSGVIRRRVWGETFAERLPLKVSSDLVPAGETVRTSKRSTEVSQAPSG